MSSTKASCSSTKASSSSTKCTSCRCSKATKCCRCSEATKYSSCWLWIRQWWWDWKLIRVFIFICCSKILCSIRFLNRIRIQFLQKLFILNNINLFEFFRLLSRCFTSHISQFEFNWLIHSLFLNLFLIFLGLN